MKHNLEKQITVLQAYTAMVKILDDYYQRTNFGDAADLLGGMMIVGESTTVDQALWEDWLYAINFVLYKKSQKCFIDEQTFDIIVKFLKIYQQNTASQEIKKLIDDVLIPGKLLPEFTSGSYRWYCAVSDVISENMKKKLTQQQGFDAMGVFLSYYPYFENIQALIDKSNRADLWGKWIKAVEAAVSGEYPVPFSRVWRL